MNRRPETFAWYFLLRFTTFLRTETRCGKGKGSRVTESIEVELDRVSFVATAGKQY